VRTLADVRGVKTLADVAAFQACWWACVAGAAHGRPWLGPAVVAAYLAGHLALGRARRGLVALAGVSLLAGLALDGTLSAARLVQFPAAVSGPWPPAPPPWMLALWVALAATLRGSLAWLAGRPGLAAAVGAVAGPAAYVAGENVGAVALLRPLAGPLLALAAGWALALSGLVLASDRLRAPRQAPCGGPPVSDRDAAG